MYNNGHFAQRAALITVMESLVHFEPCSFLFVSEFSACRFSQAESSESIPGTSSSLHSLTQAAPVIIIVCADTIMFPFPSGIGKAKRKSEMTFARPRMANSFTQRTQSGKLLMCQPSSFSLTKARRWKMIWLNYRLSPRGALFLSQQSERDSLSDMDNVIMQLLLCENYSLSAESSDGRALWQRQKCFLHPRGLEFCTPCLKVVTKFSLS